MKARYRIDDKNYLEVFLDKELFESEPHTKEAMIFPYHNGQLGQKVKKKIHFAFEEPYFIWKRKKVFLNDFEFPTVKELIEKIESGRYVFSDELLACLIKDKSFAIFAKVYLTSDGSRFFKTGDYIKTKCIPTINPKPYSYDILFRAESQSVYKYSASRSYYLWDFTMLVNSHIVLLTNRSENTCENSIPNRKKETFMKKLKRIFKKG